MDFIDFEKPFDSAEHWAVKSSLQNSRIDYRYTDLIANIYNNASFTINLTENHNTKPIKIGQGVRQGDTISPKLFNQALEDIFRKIRWDKYGININGELLNHLRYADDIVLITDNKHEIRKIIEELNIEVVRIGLIKTTCGTRGLPR